MSMLKKLIYGLLIIIAAAAVVGFMLPSKYKVQRSIVIDATPNEIYERVVDLKAWPQWGVWFQRDPQMQISYGGPDRAIGMRSNWASETQGDGEMEIIQLVHNRKIEYSLYFPEFDMGSVGRFTFEPTEDGTRVTWSDEGEVGNNPVDRYFVLMLDDMIGSDFETGLENLKTVVENQG